MEERLSIHRPAPASEADPQGRLETARRRQATLRAAAVVAVIGVLIGAALWSSRDDRNGERGQPVAQPSRTLPEVACDAEPPPEEANPQQYEEPPPLELERGLDYTAYVDTSCGEIVIDLLEEKAEMTVANFRFLASERYFNGLIWHRVEPNAVIQTGDPNGQNGEPPDGPGYTIPDELPKLGKEYVYGVVGMANAGPNTGGSQWFIVTHDPTGRATAGYDPLYTIFGKVDPRSYDVLDAIEDVVAEFGWIGGDDPADAVKPKVPIYINNITVLGEG